MKKDYWNRANKSLYYAEAIELIESLKVKSLLDVGTGPTSYLNYIAGMEVTALDKEDWGTWKDLNKDIKQIHADFLDGADHGKYDIVSSLQTLEHIDDLSRRFFINQLFKHANKYVLITVPYKWKKSFTPGHVGIDEKVIFGWFEIEPHLTRIVEEKNGIERIMNLYMKK